MTDIIEKRIAYIQKKLKINEDVLNDLVEKYVQWDGYDDSRLPEEFYDRADADDVQISCELVGRIDAFMTAMNIMFGHYDDAWDFEKVENVLAPKDNWHLSRHDCSDVEYRRRRITEIE